MQNKYRMMKKTGALQEGVSKNNFQQETSESFFNQSSFSAPMFNPQQIQQQFDSVSPMAQTSSSYYPESEETEYQDYADMHNTNVGLSAIGALSRVVHTTENETSPTQTIQHNHELTNKMSLFFYTVSEGQKVLMINKQGKGEILEGPNRVWRRGSRFIPLTQYVAYPGEFLIARQTDGSQEHIEGPASIWLDPRFYTKIEKEDALQLATKEAIVVYSQNPNHSGDPKDSDNPKQSIQRRIVLGPDVFIPQPGEWLHTFSWHGSKGHGYKKFPGELVFQKLWLMPDQMYHDVIDVRTSDDVVLTIKLMIFFELVDLPKMLDETHDPIGDFINATSSDVLDLVGRYSFEEFKKHTERLNNTESYTQLINRAKQVGYNINKIVYRGYSTTATLQTMHEQAIETRTQLKLARETEEQAQKLSDFKQQREFERAEHTRQDKKLQEIHELQLQENRHTQNLKLQQEQWESEQIQKQKLLEQELTRNQKFQEQELKYLQQLSNMNVELTSYLTQGRADQIIELRDNNNTSPHLHIEHKK